MATPVLMPKLGMTMQEGILVSWAAEPGDRVEKGRLLFVVESEKAETEIEATATGFLRHVYVSEGETAPCGALLAALCDPEDEPFDAEAFAREHGVRPSAPAPVAAAPARAAAPAAATPRRKPVAPAARKRAAELGLDPADIPGSGPGGRVTRRDVEAYADARRFRVEVAPGVSLDVPRQGAGSRVVLLPGFGTDVSVFAPQWPALSESHEVFGVNPRGVGHSDAPAEARYDVAQAAADAAAVFEGAAHVVGASLGAAVAIELALVHPERVRSLTLVTPFVHASARLLAVTEAWTQLAATAPPEVLARALLPWLFAERTLGDARARDRALRGLTATVARVPAPALLRTAEGLRAWAGTRSGDLSGIGARTLVITARDDLLTPGAAEVTAAIPNASLVEIEEAGHAVTIEAADAVRSALMQHLKAAA